MSVSLHCYGWRLDLSILLPCILSCESMAVTLYCAFLDVLVLQRNADDVTLQCTTDQFQIIWRIGDQPPFEAASYGENGSFITNIINTTVTECTRIVCTGKPDPYSIHHRIPERDILLLCPLEGLF